MRAGAQASCATRSTRALGTCCRGIPADAFAAEPERLWQAVLRRQGGDLALVATFPDDPGWN